MSENVVTLNGRTFELHEPSTSTVLSILNVIGRVGARAETAAFLQVMRQPSSRAVVFSLLAEMTMKDLTNLGVAVLQVDARDKDTVAFIEQHIRVAPLVQAFLINVSLSTDLVEAMETFLKGTALLTGMVKAVQPASETPTPAEPTSAEPAVSS
jgi:hypothetical protein